MVSRTAAARAALSAVAAVLLLLGAGGCTNGIVLLGDRDHDVVSDADVVPDADVAHGADAHGDADADADADGDAHVEGDADADADADADVEADADGHVDADGDVDADGEAEDDGGSSTCSGGWFDPSSGLCWQDPPDGTPRNWDDTMAYCDGLSLGGYADWHLPTISELRSLVRGCPATETDGACGVTDSCSGRECWDGACSGCPYGGGPGTVGAHWPSGLGGAVDWYWSSSSYAGGASGAWFVGFGRGFVGLDGKPNAYYVRCVRRGP